MTRRRIDYKTDYPANWRELVARVRERSGDRCEGSPAYPNCRAANRQPHPVTGSIVMLTTGHLYENDTMTQDMTRLRHWCQRCHAALHARHAAQTRTRQRIQAGQLLLVSEVAL